MLTGDVEVPALTELAPFRFDRETGSGIDAGRDAGSGAGVALRHFHVQLYPLRADDVGFDDAQVTLGDPAVPLEIAAPRPELFQFPLNGRVGAENGCGPVVG